MSSEDSYGVAKSSFRLIPNCNTVRYMEVPADLPGVVIFLHGVNDPGASYESVETGLCQGVNERLDRPDLKAGRYGAKYHDAKQAPRETLKDKEEQILDDPDTYLYQRDTDDPKTRSLMIPFYWGYRAAPEHVKRDDAGDPFRMRNPFQDVRGNRLDRHFANATNNLEQMYGEDFKANWKTATVEHAKPNNYLLFANAPLRHYFVLAAHRLAMLVSEIRRVSPDETITIMGHSQGTLIALLAQALLVDKGLRCADTLILVDSPYSVLPKVTPQDHDKLGNVDEGYDIVRRLGNTGVSGALVEISLATIASYLDGGASAVVYAGQDGSLTVQMIHPPDEARKERNRENRGADPFKFGSPSRDAPST
jgi:hypothetical protein